MWLQYVYLLQSFVRRGEAAADPIGICLICLILGHAYVQTPQGKSICAERKRIYSIILGDADLNKIKRDCTLQGLM